MDMFGCCFIEVLRVLKYLLLGSCRRLGGDGGRLDGAVEETNENRPVNCYCENSAPNRVDHKLRWFVQQSEGLHLEYPRGSARVPKVSEGGRNFGWHRLLRKFCRFQRLWLVHAVRARKGRVF